MKRNNENMVRYLEVLNWNLQFKTDSVDFQLKCATLKYLIKLSKQEHQYHHIGVAAGFIESLDKQVNTYLKSLVRSGCRRIKEIQNTAKERAVNTICSGEKNSAMFQAKSHLP